MKAIICLFVLLYISSLQALTELSLQGKKATQSETWSDRVANLAIDGNATSFSVAASPTNPSALGWWEVDLGGNYRIGQVVITASYEDYNAKYLQNFSIWLLDEGRNQHLCYQYSSSVSLSPNETRSFSCQDDPFDARYVRIARLGGQFRPDGISLAEVKVILRTVERLVQEVVAQPWSKIDTTNMATAHCNTWGDHFSNLAIDNDASTWSVCCLVCNKTNISGPGWWQIDLGSQRPITGVEIISSSDEYNANYLQNFIGAVSSINTTDLNQAHICFTFSRESGISPSENLTFNCNVSPIWGRYFIIIRNNLSYFRVDAIGFAEVKIFEVTGTSTINPLDNPPAPIQGISELSLIGKKATQSETWSDRVADLAIDGNATSFSVAASSSNPAALGWWEVDLGGIYRVAEVRITSSFEDYNARYLQNFTIQLLAEDRTSTTCYTYPSENSLPPNQTRSFQCSNQAPSTRYVRISRLGGNFRPDGLSLAEVQVFVSYNETGPSNVISSEVNGYEISLSGLKTHQTHTWGDHYAYLAVDNNYDTFSIACVICDNTLNSGVGWWQIDFGYDKPIVGVKLTSSKDQYNSDYLQDIIISLTSINTTDLSSARICYDFSNSSTIPAGSTLIFNCVVRPTWGRFLLVSRKVTAKFRPDAIAIAEFKAFEAAPTVPPVPIIGDPGCNTVPRSAMTAVQSGTFESHAASLGIDGNADTFFSAVNSSVVPYWSPVAWWQVDLGSMYRVMQVDITSSRDDAFARHLESFSIDVYPKSVFEDPLLTGAIQCAYYPEGRYIQPGTTEKFVCRAANYGRYVIIRKVRDFNSSVERLSAAEVTIHYA